MGAEASDSGTKPVVREMVSTRRAMGRALRLPAEPPPDVRESAAAVRDLIREAQRVARRAGFVSAGMTVVITIVIMVAAPQLAPLCGVAGVLTGAMVGFVTVKLSRLRNAERKLRELEGPAAGPRSSLLTN